MAFCPICGPKCSICCMVLSAWGVVMLGLLGVFFYIGSAALLEDVYHESHEGWDITKIDESYRSAAINCWIAAGAYVITFVAAIWQNKIGGPRTTNI